MMFLPFVFFSLSLMFSISIILSSNSFFCMWLGLELNMLSVIPLITTLESAGLVESAIKYFLVQGIASILFISSMLLGLNMSQPIMIIAYFAIILKLGAAPFHVWFVNLMNMVSTKTLFLLSTVQKLGPLLIFSALDYKIFSFEILALTVFVSLSSGILSMSFGKILAVSSMMNLAWMMMSSMKSVPLLIMFLTVYSAMLMLTILLYESVSAEGLLRGGMSNMWISLTFFFSLLSLAGMPPFIGFISKIIVLKECLTFVSLSILMMFALSSVVIMSVYLSFMFCSVSSAPNNNSVAVPLKTLAVTGMFMAVLPLLLLIMF